MLGISRDSVKHQESYTKTKPKQPAGIERGFIKDELEKRRDFLADGKEKYKAELGETTKLSIFDRLHFSNLVTSIAKLGVNLRVCLLSC